MILIKVQGVSIGNSALLGNTQLNLCHMKELNPSITL